MYIAATFIIPVSSHAILRFPYTVTQFTKNMRKAHRYI